MVHCNEFRECLEFQGSTSLKGSDVGMERAIGLESGGCVVVLTTPQLR